MYSVWGKLTLQCGPGILIGLQVSGLEKDQKYRFGVRLHRGDGWCYWIWAFFERRSLREESQVKLGIAPHEGNKGGIEKAGDLPGLYLVTKDKGEENSRTSKSTVKVDIV